MRRLKTCLPAAAWLFVLTFNIGTANAVEFKVDDGGVTTIQSPQTAPPSPQKTPIYSPPRAHDRVAQVPSAVEPITDGSFSVGDTIQSPIDGPSGESFSISDGQSALPDNFDTQIHQLPQDAVSDLSQDLGSPQEFESPQELSHEVIGEPMELSPSSSECIGVGPSCTSGIDTSHVHWKGGDVFTEGCSCLLYTSPSPRDRG